VGAAEPALEAVGRLEARAEAVCRGCALPGIEPVLDLGHTPLANALLRAEDLGRPEPCYPLEVGLCEGCGLLQLTFSVPPDELFTEYAYFSSYAPTVVANAADISRRLIVERGLDRTSLAVEIASNDGYLLQNYVEAGVPVLGIDPARNVASVAEERGVRTLTEFFSLPVAARLRVQGYAADVIHANNVLAHVPDVNSMASGIARLLADTGIAVIETPYVRDLVEGVEFDTIYHEHLFYYSLTSLRRILVRNGLEVIDVERIPIHGGSLRVIAMRSESAAPSPAVCALLAEEEHQGIATAAYYEDFAAKVASVCEYLRALVRGLRAGGKRIACYGAAAKGATLLNTLGLPGDDFEFVVDRSPIKQGRYMPGVRIPIVDPTRLLDTLPDYLLILAWNFADEIIAQESEYSRRGGRFIVPVPEPDIIPC
jgi:SAM-dependent methyltransferase